MLISDWSSDVFSSDLIGEQHTAILDAIEAHDREATEWLVREHTSGALVYLERLLGERPELFETPRRVRPRRSGSGRPVPMDGEPPAGPRSEARRVGKEGVSKCRSRCSAYH